MKSVQPLRAVDEEGLGMTEGKRQERGRGLIVRHRNSRLKHYDLILQAMGASGAG